MLPLVYLSGQNIMGTPDLATRYLLNHKFLVHLGIIPSSKTQVESSCSRDPWRVSSSHDIWGSFQVFPTWHFFTLKIIQLRMPLGDCTAIFFSSPAFTMVLSFIILKWVGLNFETLLHGQWSSGITAGWYASLLHLLCWLGYQEVVLEARVLKPPPQVLVLSRPPALFPSLPLPPGNVSINYLKWNSTKDDWSDSGTL